MSDGHYGDIIIDVSSAPYETGFKFNTVPFGGMTIAAGNAVKLSSASDVRIAPPEGRYLFLDTTGDKPEPPPADVRGALFIKRGDTSTRDRLFVCLKSDSNNYSWVEIANGGA